mmetsp:Transcript_117967/g.341025  ORF Transcript_117967/g.341025 Transcript_117967/m.341025 type:complete len:254 (+) Transcript_117967:2194-2955(+)
MDVAGLRLVLGVLLVALQGGLPHAGRSQASRQRRLGAVIFQLGRVGAGHRRHPGHGVACLLLREALPLSRRADKIHHDRYGDDELWPLGRGHRQHAALHGRGPLALVGGHRAGGCGVGHVEPRADAGHHVWGHPLREGFGHRQALTGFEHPRRAQWSGGVRWRELALQTRFAARAQGVVLADRSRFPGGRHRPDGRWQKHARLLPLSLGRRPAAEWHDLARWGRHADIGLDDLAAWHVDDPSRPGADGRLGAV